MLYCTQYCLTWVFLPFVHVVKCLICLVCIVASFMLPCVQLLLLGRVYCCSYLMCICCTVCALPFFFTLNAGLLARSQYSEGPATGHLDTSFSRFPCVYKQMLRRFPRFQVATTCFSCSPPDLNLVVTNFMFCSDVKKPLPPGNNPIAINKYIIIIIYVIQRILVL